MPTISIHTTLAGGDEKALNKARVIASISIHTTLAGGDRKSELEDIIWRTISIHTTLAGGDEDGDCTGYSPVISIHTTLAGGDWRICMRQQVFWISIHTTLAGGDCLGAIVNFFNNDFNPHHPRGWRLWITLSRGLFVYFNPHHPRGWRLGFLRGLCPRRNISIHTTLAGGDHLFKFI